jgi:hypothetical protein
MTKSCYTKIIQKTPNGFDVKDRYCCPKQKTTVSDYIGNSSNDIKNNKTNNNNKKYFYNNAQRLKARFMSFEENQPSQKNMINCCKDNSNNCCRKTPINKQQYGLNNYLSGKPSIPVGVSSGARTFALAQSENTVSKNIKVVDSANKLWYQKSCPPQRTYIVSDN